MLYACVYLLELCALNRSVQVRTQAIKFSKNVTNYYYRRISTIAVNGLIFNAINLQHNKVWIL